MSWHFSEHFGFSVLLLPYFLVIFLRRLDPVFDEVAEEEGGEGFEDLEEQANQGKQPFDHVTPLVHWWWTMTLVKLVVNHPTMHTPTHDLTLFMIA